MSIYVVQEQHYANNRFVVFFGKWSDHMHSQICIELHDQQCLIYYDHDQFKKQIDKGNAHLKLAKAP